MQTTVQQVLEDEMDEALGAGKSERRGYRGGYYGRKLTTRGGPFELRLPQDRGGLFRTEIFVRYQRSEKTLLLPWPSCMSIGVSTRKVRAVTEELCGHGFSASTVSAIIVQLDAALERSVTRPLSVRPQRF